MKKVFGEINLTLPKVIIMAIMAGIYTAIMAMLAITKDTSFSDIAVTFEVWIFFGIFIIMNSKSALDSAIKCFVFFVISQPLVYLVQDIINHSNLFITYYRNWIWWTICTIPMGFLGYFMKKDKWWGLIFILLPILILLGDQFSTYFSKMLFSFPRHTLTTIFCAGTLIIYPIAIFKNKMLKVIGTILSSIIIVAMVTLTLISPPIYDTTILSSGGEEGLVFDNTYKAYLTDESYGDVYFKYEENIESWLLNVKFKKAGKVDLVLESPNLEKIIYEVYVERDTYKLMKK